MDYLKSIIITTHEGADVVASEISPLCGACIIDDPKTVDELLNSPSPRWDYIGEEVFENADRPVTVSFFADDDESGRRIISDVSDILEALKNEGGKGFYGSLEMKTVIVKDENWQNNWKQYFKPFPVGEKLIVRPSWEECENTGKTELVIDPASSFGTGSHATTKMCLEHFQTLDISGKNVFDAGCGSGILACCSLLFGAKHALACDIEENAMTATAENMRLNNIPKDKYETLLGDLLTDARVRDEISKKAPFDLISANIVADVLIAMLPYLKSWLKPDGRLIISGIIDTRADEVLNAYLSAGLKKRGDRKDGGWVMYDFSK
ncbi:MAG: 50S ribosomal protein L11 methyltransferase [Clostridia bacterium]|nr:50S ribosomal protein L11 methyltransferase [Clostridia bacterium]